MKKIILLLSETWFLFKVLLFDHKLTPKFLYYINKINFIELLSCSLEKNIPLSNLKRLHIMLGNQCNYRCKMCGQKDFNQEMNPIIYKKRLVSCYPYLKEIILQGGEPTVVPKTKEFIEFLLKKNPKIKFGIMTNGYMFDNFWIQKFIKHGSFVNFSLNAASKKIYKKITKHGNWDKVISNLKKLIYLKKLKKSNLDIAASFVILEDNLHELSKFIQFCQNLKVDRVRFFFDFNQWPKNKSLIKKELKKSFLLEKKFHNLKIEGLYGFEAGELNKNLKYPNCSLPFESIQVLVNGLVNFCCHNSNFYLGNLQKKPINKLWNNLEAKRFRRLFKKKDYRYCNIKKCVNLDFM